MRILIAEDDAPLASFVKKGLEAEHYAVDVSADGEQARATAADFDYDLVVLDLNLPRLDGISILRNVRTSLCQITSTSYRFQTPEKSEKWAITLHKCGILGQIGTGKITSSEVRQHTSCEP